MRTMLRNTQSDDELVAQTVDELRRKVAWQVSVAYDLPLGEIDAPEPPPVAVPVTVLPTPAPPEPEPELPPAALAVPTLTELERLVANAGDSDPARVEEWRWYLFYLRDFAKADGTLDDTFGLLVETAFGELLQAEPRIH